MDMRENFTKLKRFVRRRTLHKVQKKITFFKSVHLHKKILRELDKQGLIHVVFLCNALSTWKSETVLKAFLSDTRFKTTVVVTPITSIIDKASIDSAQETYDALTNRGYNCLLPYDHNKHEWMPLEKLLKIDIVFFCNPHNITRLEYYKILFENHLSCYIPYDHMISRYDDNMPQYNQSFHNAMWKIFVPSNENRKIFENCCEARAKNVVVTGFPFCEQLLPCNVPQAVSPWKNNFRKKIIWAPHHTIEVGTPLPLSSFLKYASLFVALREKYKDFIQWAFKPHPLLKSKLYAHPEWGRQKTDEYYEGWNLADNRLHDGEYVDLFLTSDAIIHDCGSFLAEYQYTMKPRLFLVNEYTTGLLNELGKQAINSCEQAKTADEIVDFIEALRDQTFYVNNRFVEQQISEHFCHSLPSAQIYSHIVASLGLPQTSVTLSDSQ